MKLNDLLSGFLLMLLAVAVLVNISSFPTIPGQNIGPAAFPGLLAWLLLLCSVVLMVRSFRTAVRSPLIEMGAWVRSPYHLRNFAITTGCLLFYILASDFLGFLICAFAILCTMFWALKVRAKLIVPIALGVTLLIHTIFYKGLRVPLPWGILLPVQW